MFDLARASDLLDKTGFWRVEWSHPVMWLIALVLIYLAIKKNYEPYLLIPIGFAVLLVNLPGAGLGEEKGILWFFYHYGIQEFDLLPPLIFLGLGATTDFGPLIANPKTVLLGAAAQIGVYAALFGSLLLGFNLLEAASIGIIGGADGPTTIWLTRSLAPDILGRTALCAYSYMALVPIIIPPLVRILTTKKERGIVMKQLRPVSKTEKICFPLVTAGIIILIVPMSAPLISMFMLGNLLKESGVVKRLSEVAGGAIMNAVTIFLGLAVGSRLTAERFLDAETLGIFGLGLAAFCFSVIGGVLFAKAMNLFSKNKINPMIGAAGLSAVPMASRVVQVMGQKENPGNFLLMHAMGPNVAGVIGTIVAAGIFRALLGG